MDLDKEFELFLKYISLIDPEDEKKPLAKGFGLVNVKDESLYFKMFIEEENEERRKNLFLSEMARNKNTNLCNFIAVDTFGYKWQFNTFSFSESMIFSEESMNSIYGEIRHLYY